MDNKTEYFTLKEDGVIGWIEDMPVAHHKLWKDDIEKTVEEHRYQQALQSAISNAKPVVNQDEVEKRICDAVRAMVINHPYPLQCHVEKKEFCEDFAEEGRPFECPFNGSERHKTVALVTFSEPEIRTALCIQGHPDGLTKGKVYNVVGESDKFFDIKPDDFGHLSGFDKRYFSEPSAGVEETQEELKIDLWNKVIELLMFCEADGTVVNGYRSQEIINQLRDITRKNK